MKIATVKCPECDEDTTVTVDDEGNERILDNNTQIFDLVAGPALKPGTQEQVKPPLVQKAMGLAYVEHSAVCSAKAVDAAQTTMFEHVDFQTDAEVSCDCGICKVIHGIEERAVAAAAREKQ